MDDLVQSLHEAACGTGDEDMAYLLREAAAALEAAREDAERYRWLRGSHWYVGPEPDGDTEGVSLCDQNDGTLGAAIDAARGARNG